MICLLLSIVLHVLLIWFVPLLSKPIGGSSTVAKEEPSVGVDAISFSTFENDVAFSDVAGSDETATIAPLPVAEMTEMIKADQDQPANDDTPVEQDLFAEEVDSQPLDALINESADELAKDIESAMDTLLDEFLTADNPDRSLASGHSDIAQSVPSAPPPPPIAPSDSSIRVEAQSASVASAPRATVAGELQNDFANRVGSAKQEALLRTGGNVDTEQAVAAALKFLASAQRSDGAWDPAASRAGRERAPLGMNRGGAGSRAETAITGLALLALIGAGNTHADGEYADNVYRGLAYLIGQQEPDGSLAGNASVYAANYSHGMAALAMCEAAAITRDPSAIESARRAMAHTIRMQHPSTGGWRYTAGDPGDLSQAGWQVMVLDAGRRAGIPIDQASTNGAQRFLRSVRAGSGGLACYRPREAPSRTMTAEALATRLLLGERVPKAEIGEAERYLLQQPPGVGQDNYYYWYYATLALHQLQDTAWQNWNRSLQRRLLATQRTDGSWPTTSLWGGYGGTVYTTSMGALCLETYYRHALRDHPARVATRESSIR